MQTLFALLFAVAAACAVARPPAGYPMESVSKPDPPRILPMRPVPRKFFREFIFPVLLGYHETPQIPYHLAQAFPPDYLNQEIERLKRMKDNMMLSYQPGTQWMAQQSYPKRIFGPFGVFDPRSDPMYSQPQRSKSFPLPDQQMMQQEPLVPPMKKTNEPTTQKNTLTQPKQTAADNARKQLFALTPTDAGYFENVTTNTARTLSKVVSEGGELPLIEIEPPRKTRQNPLSRSKTLIAENMEKLKIGLGQEDSSEKPHHIHVLEAAPPDPAGSIYGVALIAAVGAAISMAVLGFAFGWYTLSKRAKAAADVDYPAYGVTGPTIDTSGDRKLAHSAHMYHYHHQKQQIIAMERNGMDQHNGSVSDPESEEENEEGHYTVYECPGFATTGDMEVKNPLFNEEPTPATPGKCEIVKPQPKE